MNDFQQDQILENLVQNVFSAIPPNVLKLLKIASITHWFNYDILYTVISADESHNIKNDWVNDYIRLKNLPFVDSYGAKGLCIHEVMRISILDYLWKYDRVTYKEISRILTHYFKDIESDDGRVEYLYHGILDNSDDSVRTVRNVLQEWFYAPNCKYDQVFSLISAVEEHTKSKRIINSNLTGLIALYASMINLKFNRFSQAKEALESALLLPELDNLMIGNIYLRLAESRRVLWDISRAEKDFLKSLEILSRLGDKKGEADSLRGLGHIARAKSDFTISLEYYNKAKIVYKEIGDFQGEATMLRGSGHIHREEGFYDEALDEYKESLLLSERVNDKFEQVNALYRIGEVNRLIGDNSNSVIYFEKSISLCRAIGDKQHNGLSLIGLAKIDAEKLDFDSSINKLKNAIGIFEEINHTRGKAQALLAIGEVEISRDRLKEAHQYLNNALNLFESTGSKNGQADSLRNLAIAAWREGDLQQAKSFGSKSGKIYENLDGFVNLGYASEAFYFGGVYSKSIQLAKQSLKLAENPTYFNWISFNLARSLLNSHKSKSAKKIYVSTIDSEGNVNILIREIGYLRLLQKMQFESEALPEIIDYLEHKVSKK